MRNSTLKFCAMLLAICTSVIHLQAMDEWDGATIAKGFYSGTGTKADPYRIFTASQFLYFLQQTKDGNTFNGQYIELCNDIAFKSNEGLVEGGDFYGDFDGNDHTIQVNKYKQEYEDYLWGGWHLFNLYGSMHDVLFIRANYAMSIYTGGILYNCIFEFPSSYPAGYHGDWTVLLKGGTIANCVSNSASWKNRLEQGLAGGFVSDSRCQSSGYCLNCYFPITSYPYSGSAEPNYYGVIESCGEEAGNDWVLNHTEYAYKSWPLTFNPTYPEYQIKEQPQPYNPSVVYPHSDEALFQWYYQERKPIIFEDITSSSSIQTKNIVVPDDDVVLSFDFETHGYVYTGYNDGDDKLAWISVNGEKIVSVYDEKEGTYSSQVSAGTYEISCERSDIKNICITYPTETLANEISSTLSKQTIVEKPGVYFCQVSYGEGCDVMYSDYVDYEKLLTIDNVTYVINEDATATVLWVADKAVDITILGTVNYDDVNYPVTSISSKAFVDCTSLASVKCKTSDVPTPLGDTAFEGLIPSNATLTVPNGSAKAYSDMGGFWGQFASIKEEANVNISEENMWSTCVLAFDAELPEGVRAFISTGMDENSVLMEEVTTLEAYKPYVLYAQNGYEGTLTGVVDLTAYQETVTDGVLSGAIVKQEASSGYILQNQGQGSKFYNMNGQTFTIPAGKCWLSAFDAGASSVTMRFSDGANDIEGVYMDAPIDTPVNETIYDLEGKPVEEMMSGRVYIVGGKKIMKR